MGAIFSVGLDPGAGTCAEDAHDLPRGARGGPSQYRGMTDGHSPLARSAMDDFVTTRWSLILEAQREPTLDGQPALAALCDLYWYPLYAYLRRRGHHREEAEDLTQGYFAYLLEHRSLDHVDRARGRFRSFLLASLNHYVANDRDWHRAEKRRGVISHVPLNQDAADARYRA